MSLAVGCTPCREMSSPWFVALPGSRSAPAPAPRPSRSVPLCPRRRARRARRHLDNRRQFVRAVGAAQIGDGKLEADQDRIDPSAAQNRADPRYYLAVGRGFSPVQVCCERRRLGSWPSRLTVSHFSPAGIPELRRRARRLVRRRRPGPRSCAGRRLSPGSLPASGAAASSSPRLAAGIGPAC